MVKAPNIEGTGGGLRRGAKAGVRVVDTGPVRGGDLLLLVRESRTPQPVTRCRQPPTAYPEHSPPRGNPLKIRVSSAAQDGSRRSLSARRRRTCKGT